MLWFADLAAGIDAGRPHVINDSKTPSGRVHVGALRGVIIHDAVFRALKARGVPVRYYFGVDDYDPVDEIPAGQGEHFEKYRGAPLCNVPAPAGSSAPDMAEHFISEFFALFRVLGVDAEHYRMRDFYRSGSLDETIDKILGSAEAVRRVYKEVSNSNRSPHWHPFQVVCQVCGRIGTTEVVAYDGKEVEYHCRPNLVKWAKGCGHHGKMSPFAGGGKLPWKLEWVAKWRRLGVTIEGAGKDHTTKGGARDVSGACLEAVFGEKPPLNIPYEFFLVGGAKMSSSKGIGSSARDVADFLPPEILRFLILRTQPKTPVNFDMGQEFIVKLFNDFDRLHKRISDDPKIQDDEKELYRLCEIDAGASEGAYFDASFQLVLTFLQMPHVDLVAEMEKRKGAPLTAVEKKHLDARINAARYWLDRVASEDEKVHLQEALPARAAELSQTQRAFLNKLAAAVKDAEWKEDVLQACVFDTARRTPIAQSAAFQAVYRVFLDKPQGPPAGALMAVLERDFVLKRLAELPCDEGAFWQESASKPEEIEGWLAKERQHIVGIEQRRLERDGRVFVEVEARTDDGKSHVKRAVFGEAAAVSAFAERLDALRTPPAGLES
jgi:lysyl-tRNA synthetase class 1